MEVPSIPADEPPVLTTVDPTPPPALSALARARLCANQGKLAEALALCQQAAADERLNPAVYLLSATVHNELGQLPEAVTAFGRVLFLDPDSALAHHALGGIYRRLSKGKDSQRHFAIALKLLAARRKDDLVPDSDGMTCGRLAECVRAAVGI
jgi:chemotaxis protein methyltransferase CheR